MNSTWFAALGQLLAEGNEAVPGIWSYGGLTILAFFAVSAVKVLFKRETTASDRERLRADRLEEEVRRLNASIHDQYIPTLTKATEVISEVLAASRRGPER